MQYQIEIEIDLSRSIVIEKFKNADNLKHWQKDLLSTEHLSGNPGKNGATTKFTYLMGKRAIEMIETVTNNGLPDAFHSTFQANGVLNIQENYFTAIDSQKTRWTTKSQFKFTSLTMKIMGFLMPGAFKKQTLKYMAAFKNFAENGRSVAND